MCVRGEFRVFRWSKKEKKKSRNSRLVQGAGQGGGSGGQGEPPGVGSKCGGMVKSKGIKSMGVRVWKITEFHQARQRGRPSQAKTKGRPSEMNQEMIQTKRGDTKSQGQANEGSKGATKGQGGSKAPRAEGARQEGKGWSRGGSKNVQEGIRAFTKPGEGRLKEGSKNGKSKVTGFKKIKKEQRRTKIKKHGQGGPEFTSEKEK